MLDALPHVHAALNTGVAFLLILGLYAIRNGRRRFHQYAMTGALALSAVFLGSYLFYHFHRGATPFTGQGFIRPVYFAILLSHTVLATLSLPFIIWTVVRAWRGDFEAHARMARKTYWVWLYVAVTGPVVYLLLYHLYAPDFEAARRLHESGQDAVALKRYRTLADRGHVGAGCFAAVLGHRIERPETDSATVSDDVLKALQAQADEPLCGTLLGRELIYRNQLEEAERWLRKAVAARPRDAWVHSSLGYALFRQYRYEKAAQAFQSAMSLQPENGVHAYNAGYAYFLLREFERAAPLYEKALRLGLEGALVQRARQELATMKGTLFSCPMHPHETGEAGDVCGQCGMKLTKDESVRPERLRAPVIEGQGVE